MKYLKRYTLILVFLFIGCKQNNISLIKLEYSPDELEIFGDNIISTGLYERDIAISPDGKEIIFTIGNYKQTIMCLVKIEKNKNVWGNKQIINFSGRYNDIEPFFSFDGKQLFFASNRPLGEDSIRKDYNIWVSEKIESQWGDPKPLHSNINTEENEFYPSVSKNGNLYFTTTRENGIGREDIYLSRYIDGVYQEPELLDTAINSVLYEFNAFINPNENLLIFSSYGREDDLGGGDLYFSKKDENGKWNKAKNLGSEINSKELDYCPFIDLQRGNFYFTSERTEILDKRIESIPEFTNQSNKVLNGMGNIYRINIEKLNLINH